MLNDPATLLPEHFDRNLARILKTDGVDALPPTSSSGVDADPDAVQYWRSQLESLNISSCCEAVRDSRAREDEDGCDDI